MSSSEFVGCDIGRNAMNLKGRNIDGAFVMFLLTKIHTTSNTNMVPITIGNDLCSYVNKTSPFFLRPDPYLLSQISLPIPVNISLEK